MFRNKTQQQTKKPTCKRNNAIANEITQQQNQKHDSKINNMTANPITVKRIS